ncbi:MAG TPA: SH3 domain-containing protein [Candidatus Angelobacter sp.]
MRDSHVPGPAIHISIFSLRAFLLLAASLVVFFLGFAVAGCRNDFSGKAEYVYVAAPQVSLRDRVATIFNKTGLVHNGERLQVLERMQNRRFVRVRTPRGEEGWVQERYLTSQKTFDQFQRLAEQFKDTPAQSTATVTQPINLHVLPGRITEHLYVLDEKQKVGLLQRQPVNRNAAPAPPKDPDAESDSSGDDAGSNTQPANWEDWWLVRDAQQRVGWVWGHVLYLDVPDEIGQYAEGQRIIGAYPLDQVEDQGRKVSEYLVLLTQPKDGMPYDFDQIRVYTWNTRKHRYETAYHERNLAGSLPVALGQQDFGNEGTLRTFTLRVKDDEGQVKERVYKFKPPIVHRVLAPGEQPPAKAKHKAGHRTG